MAHFKLLRARVKPEVFLDTRIIAELERDGFFKRLAAKQARLAHRRQQMNSPQRTQRGCAATETRNISRKGAKTQRV